jgi:MOSC domain-containing protein YiiM/GNAT superfamily N-acetyltransferase
MSDGRLLQVNVSSGGVPKLPVVAARVTSSGVEGDRQRSITVHGGPHRAVSLLGIEAIRRVAAEGHPIAPGTTGENLTTEGFDVSALPLGTRLAIGDDVEIELSAPTNPCRTIRHSFRDLRYGRLSMAAHPGDGRMYARVLREGVVRPGDPIRLTPPADDRAERYLLNDRLDGAERVSSLAFWAAAEAAGHEVHVQDDGEIAVAATPSLPGPAFNTGIGFAHLPNLVGLALEHFRDHDVTGWVVADDPPWPGAVADTTLARYAAEPSEVAGSDRPSTAVRELARDEIGPWSEVITASSEFPAPVAQAWRSLEPSLARAVHHHRYVVELDGHAVAAASLHTHHALGWMRAGSVLPAYRGRGLQRVMLAFRAREALRRGCDLVGASAIDGGVSARNLEAMGFRRIGTRRTYRVAAA